MSEKLEKLHSKRVEKIDNFDQIRLCKLRNEILKEYLTSEESLKVAFSDVVSVVVDPLSSPLETSGEDLMVDFDILCG